MASPLLSLSKSITVIPTSVNDSTEKSLCCNFQNLRSTRCLKGVSLKPSVSAFLLSRKLFRGSGVPGFKCLLQFCQFAKIFDVEMEMKNQHFKILEEISCTDGTGLILSIINLGHKSPSNLLLGAHNYWCKHLQLLKGLEKLLLSNNRENNNDQFWRSYSFVFVISSWFSSCQVAQSSVGDKTDMVYEIGELFELGIQLSYLLILLGLLGLGTFFVIRQVLVRRELDLSAKELQEQVRSGDATATEYFELGAVMLRRKIYPAATKYLRQAIEKWDRDDQDLAQVYNALGVSYVRDNKVEKGIAQFEAAVKLQPGYVTAWNNMGDAYEKKKNLKMALRAFDQALLFDPNNKIARPRRDALRERVELYKGVPLKSEER